MKLQEKKILFFVPDFFDYYKSIELELNRRGAYVYTILENYSNRSFLYRLFLIKNRLTKYWFTKNKILKVIDNIKADIDVIFVVRGEAISPEIMGVLKLKYPNALFLMYQWDSIHNNPNAKVIADYFDKIYTFDRIDSVSMGWIYRPLFYIDESCCADYSLRKYDLAFIGTLYYKRAQVYRKLVKLSNENGWCFFGYLFSLKYVFYLHKYLMRDKRYKDIKRKDVKFRALSKTEISEIYRNSKIVIDYTADTQSGFTMRTIESIGNRCKLLTNNKMIVKEKFYKKENICIYDLNNFTIPKEFLTSKFVDLETEDFRYLSLAGWIDTIFEV